MIAKDTLKTNQISIRPVIKKYKRSICKSVYHLTNTLLSFVLSFCLDLMFIFRRLQYKQINEGIDAPIRLI